MEKVFQAMGERSMWLGSPSLIYGKIDFTLKLVMRQRKFILIKGSSSQETIAILDIYTPNSDVPPFY